MRFLVDTQLPPRLAKWLQAQGFEAIHTTFFENGHLLKDAEIIKIASDQDRIVVTKDTDFLNHYFLKGIPPRVFLLEIGNSDNKVLIEILNRNFIAVQNLFDSGKALVILRNDAIIAY